MESDAAGFYNSLANDYHLIFEDWWEAAQRHGELIDGQLRRRGVAPPARVLDCTCGIGTQALSLAQLGYRVVGTDLSEHAVARAGREAAARQIPIELAAADVRHLGRSVRGPFDVVMSCDNSLPHLLTGADLLSALGEIWSVLQSDGLFLASVRDYDALASERPTGTTPRVYQGDDGRDRIVGQAWEWDDRGVTVKIHLFLLWPADERWECRVRSTTYRAWRRHELTALIDQAGFTDIEWSEPSESGFYQPIVIARRSG